MATRAGLRLEAKLQKLTELTLSSTKITDAGLKEVAKLQNLDWLSLSGTKITDAGIGELAKLRKLTSLYLPRAISDENIKELQKALPDCEINYN